MSSHLMKTTKRGRPFVKVSCWVVRADDRKDTQDLFSTLIVSLNLSTHRSFFKTYPNSFTT